MIKNFQFPEGATPIPECSGLIPTWVHNLSDLNRIEGTNIHYAHRKYLRPPISHPKYWFNVKQLRTIHRAMFGRVWDWAGEYRKSITSIGIHPTLIPSKFAELCFEVISWLESPVGFTFLEMAARIHHKLVFIHPFENGNGRFSRLIADRFLLAFQYSYPRWPSNIYQEGDIRKTYIQALKDADRGDYLPLINLMKQLGANLILPHPRG
jgi:Fic-DOC domain mobile mystery protein B